jgi:hypothetical protein
VDTEERKVRVVFDGLRLRLRLPFCATRSRLIEGGARDRDIERVKIDGARSARATKLVLYALAASAPVSRTKTRTRKGSRQLDSTTTFISCCSHSFVLAHLLLICSSSRSSSTSSSNFPYSPSCWTPFPPPSDGQRVLQQDHGRPPLPQEIESALLTPHPGHGDWRIQHEKSGLPGQ